MTPVTSSSQVSSFSYQTCIPKDDSFASYLAVVRDNLTPELAIARPAPCRISLTRKLADDYNEIDIFTAEKYFSSTTETPQPPDAATIEITTKPPSIFVDRTPLRTAATAIYALSKSTSLTWTATGSSCAASDTSHNHHNALVRDRRRAFDLGRLGFWCSSCSRKHAVNVSKASGTTASISHSSASAEQNQDTSWSPASWRIEMARPGPWPWPDSTGGATSTLQRCRLPPQSALPPPKILGNEDDAGSESSSDLFEIESVGLSRTEVVGYEPSEASIAWSVVTASAATVSVETDQSDGIVGRRGRQGRKRTGILLAGCSNHKAVEVLEQRASGERFEKGGLSAAVAVESSTTPVVSRNHVELESGSGSGRIVADQNIGTSWHGGSGRIVV